MVKSKRSDQLQQATVAALRISGHLLDLCSRPLPSTPALLFQEHVEIRCHLSEIDELQKSLVAQSPNAQQPTEVKTDCRESKIAQFLEWASKAGIQPNGVTVAACPGYGGGVGLQATDDLTEGHLCVTVPRRAMLTSDKALKSADMKYAVERDPLLRGMTNVTLALLLLCEKLRGQSSYWHKYIDFLPQSYNTALYFTVEEMQLLKGSASFEEALKMFRNISRQFAYFHQILGGNTGLLVKTPLTVKNLTFDAYRWAVSTVMTRINFVPREDDAYTQIPALIPFLDLANHREGRTAPEYEEATECASVKTDRAYKASEQIYIFYGARNNGDFLLHDGFVPAGPNANNYIKVKLGLATSDKSAALKTAKLAELGVEARGEEFRLAVGFLDEKMRVFARVFVAGPDVLEGGKPLDEGENEKKALEFLKMRFQLLQKGYAADLSAVDSQNAKFIALLVESEKEILRDAVRIVDEQLNKCL